MSLIKGAEYPLSKIFCSDFDYFVPSYQRPYAWTGDESNLLFDDLYNSFLNNPNEGYFLGSIVLIKKENEPHAEVIDGQQRLTTLTILLSAITSCLEGKDRIDYQGYLREAGRASQGIEPKPRLKLRDRDNDFFAKYIVNEVNFIELNQLPKSQDSEAKTNIINNSILIKSKLVEKCDTPQKVMDFGRYLVSQCYLVAVSTPSQDSAYRIFSVLNSRGMSLLATDILKADLIGAINETQQIAYTSKWEEVENELTRDGFNDLFGQIRMIKARTKAKESLQKEFRRFVVPTISSQNAIEFIDNSLLPYSEAYGTITKSQYESSEDVFKLNNYFRWLNKIDNSDWLPVAIEFLKRNLTNVTLLTVFYRKLERLAAFIHATSKDINFRIARYGEILTELDTLPKNIIPQKIELKPEEKTEFITVLNSDIYWLTAKRRNYLILRLDSFISDGAATYTPKVLTIEHVLPQTVSPGSYWETNWPSEEEREKWLHKIGNLVPLPRRTNSAAQNYDFDYKKEAYFSGRTGVSSYALTTQVLSYSTWTPSIVEQRQKDLVKCYIQEWELSN